MIISESYRFIMTQCLSSYMLCRSPKLQSRHKNGRENDLSIQKSPCLPQESYLRMIEMRITYSVRYCTPYLGDSCSRNFKLEKVMLLGESRPICSHPTPNKMVEKNRLAGLYVRRTFSIANLNEDSVEVVLLIYHRCDLTSDGLLERSVEMKIPFTVSEPSTCAGKIVVGDCNH